MKTHGDFCVQNREKRTSTGKSALWADAFFTPLCPNRRAPSGLEEMRKVMEEEGPFAAVHAHLLFFNGFVLLAARRAGISIRISHSHASSLLKYHSLKGKGYAAFMRRLLMKNATCLLACSKQAGIYLYGEKAVRAGGWNFLQTPWTWTPLLFAPKRRPNCARSSARGRKPLVIGQVGRMIPGKNHVFLLELARLLKEKGAGLAGFFSSGTGLCAHPSRRR